MARPLLKRALAGTLPTRADLRRARRDILRRLSVALREEREYWTPVLRDLRDQHARGLLLAEGTPVRGISAPPE